MAWAACMLCASSVTAIHYDFELRTQCPSAHVATDMSLPSPAWGPHALLSRPLPAPEWSADPNSQSTLYNEAYEWTKQVPLQHWQFSELPPTRRMRRSLNTDPHENLDCAHVSYSGSVKVPHTLDAYLDLGHFNAHVQKTVCASPTVIYTNITLSNIPVVGSVFIHSEMRRDKDTAHLHHDANSVVTTCNAKYDLPWYLRWIDANSMIYKSYRADVKASIHQLCNISEETEMMWDA